MMKPLFLTLVVALIAIQAVSQAPPPAPPARINTGIIEGTVTRTGTPPEPISGVQIQLNIAQAIRGAGLTPDVTLLDVISDDTGHFVFKDLYPGPYQLRYQREGFFPLPGGAAVQISGAATAPQALGGRGAAVGANAAAQSTITFRLDTARPVTLSIPMIPGGVISGRIIDTNGRAVAASQVLAMRLAYQDGHRILNSAKTTTTNDRGEYRLFGLEPGEYYVRSDFRRPATGRGGVQDVFRIYFPGVPDADRALRIPVTSGTESSGANFTTQTTTTVKLSGMVVNRIPTMAPPAPVTAVLNSVGTIDTQALPAQRLAAPNFFLAPRDASALVDNLVQLQNTFTPATERVQGKFEISGVQPGRYELYAVVRETTANNTQVQHVGHTSIDVGTQDVAGIAVVIEPVGEVRVRFVGNGDPAIQFLIPPAPQMRPRDAVPPVVRNTPLVRAQTDAAGWHVYSPAMEGPYMLDSQLASLRDAYIADIRQGDKSIYETGTITVSSAPETVEIILARPAGSITGNVQNAAAMPASGILVTLIPNGARRENLLLYKRATTDANGQFNLIALAPGEYKLFAWENLPSGAELSAEFMKDYDDRGVPVTVTAGAQLKAQLPLVSAKN